MDNGDAERGEYEAEDEKSSWIGREDRATAVLDGSTGVHFIVGWMTDAPRANHCRTTVRFGDIFVAVEHYWDK